MRFGQFLSIKLCALISALTGLLAGFQHCMCLMQPRMTLARTLKLFKLPDQAADAGPEALHTPGCTTGA